MINPKWLTTYIALVEEGHFTRTAEKLYMTQPGVSQHIAKLEQECGTPLLQRQGKTFELTPAGDKLYQFALEQLELHEQLLDTITVDDPNKGLARVACSGALTQQLYSRCINIQKDYPELHFAFESCSNQGAMNRVLNGQSDVALITQQAVNPLLSYQQIGLQKLSLVVPQLSDAKTVSAEYLHQLGLVAHPDALHYLSLYRHSSQHSLLSDMDIAHIPQVSFVNQLEQILAPISLGVGFTVLPSSCVELSPYKDRLSVINVGLPVVEKVYLVTKISKPLPSFYQHFVELCKRTLQADTA
ncbi:LysR family transcriptional regulator [Vibrio ulleungensis]|uniref:LysR family transcriptional regulator n=1 Tax=Vibrio ulleungensis TaxID=2807619 RepID=A0ABS2HG97_9VIBR|nr:LysR family transcriptional regulator [Vibrio ulleungensis]MBM7035467.1 LysR family transcriptional regulator [Vibrio ulleungensis]